MSSRDETSTPDGEVPPTQAIIEAIAAHEGVDVTEVEPPAYDPLFTVVNPEALDELFHTTAGTASDVVVRLEYEGYDIVVRPGSDVDIRDSSSRDSVNSPIEE
ncbi:HalOD1 output domain-containing protein [Natrinema amylolyticum]|uniref:HalOD1 output domain-containing protein n=1 Tax=Natrinema amylolyticum TaxID=2878679 RepID=UPI001CFA3C70|nr:HalOD1 output domain-containing protein [Natrinema amylolyticum]